MNRLLVWFPSIAGAVRRVEAASPRERVLLVVAAYALLALFLYFAVLDPSIAYRADQVRAQSAAENGLNWMRANERAAKSQSGTAGAVRGDNELATISSSAELRNLEIKRMQPGDNRISVELEEQSYADLIRWLIALETDHDFTLVDVRIDKIAEGVVNSRISVR